MVGPHPISPGASHFSLMPQNDEECTRLAGCRSHVYSDGRDAHETSRLNPLQSIQFVFVNHGQ